MGQGVGAVVMGGGHGDEREMAKPGIVKDRSQRKKRKCNYGK